MPWLMPKPTQKRALQTFLYNKPRVDRPYQNVYTRNCELLAKSTTVVPKYNVLLIHQHVLNVGAVSPVLWCYTSLHIMIAASRTLDLQNAYSDLCSAIIIVLQQYLRTFTLCLAL